MSELPLGGAVFLGVRHHSPACAALVARTVAELRPGLVLVEGPADLNPRLDELLLGHELPVAVFSHYRDEERTATSWAPFCAYSPEWVALTAGRAAGAEVRFIDLPAWHPAFSSREQPLTNRFADAEARYAEATERLCRAFGTDSVDTLWDGLVELPDPQGLAERLDAYFELVRGDAVPQPGDAAREAYMASWVRAALARAGGRPVLVVTGGFHTPALRALVAPTEPADKEAVDGRPANSESADGWPEVPAPPDGAVGGSFLVPYSFAQLDAFGGYQSGMPSPGYYQLLWERGAEGAADGLTEQVVRRLRGARQEVSTADLIAARTLADGLAMMRGHRVRSRADVLDGLAGALVGEALEAPLPWQGRLRPTAGPDPLVRELVAAGTGDRVGRLHPDTPAPPLVHDVAAEQERCGVTLGRPVTADLTDGTQLLRSQFLHRLRVLGVPGHVRESGPAGGGDPVFTERWVPEPGGWAHRRDAALVEAARTGAAGRGGSRGAGGAGGGGGCGAGRAGRPAVRRGAVRGGVADRRAAGHAGRPGRRGRRTGRGGPGVGDGAGPVAARPGVRGGRRRAARRGTGRGVPAGAVAGRGAARRGGGRSGPAARRARGPGRAAVRGRDADGPPVHRAGHRRPDRRGSGRAAGSAGRGARPVLVAPAVRSAAQEHRRNRRPGPGVGGRSGAAGRLAGGPVRVDPGAVDRPRAGHGGPAVAVRRPGRDRHRAGAGRVPARTARPAAGVRVLPAARAGADRRPAAGPPRARRFGARAAAHRRRPLAAGPGRRARTVRRRAAVGLWTVAVRAGDGRTDSGRDSDVRPDCRTGRGGCHHGHGGERRAGAAGRGAGALAADPGRARGAVHRGAVRAGRRAGRRAGVAVRPRPGGGPARGAAGRAAAAVRRDRGFPAHGGGLAGRRAPAVPQGDGGAPGAGRGGAVRHRRDRHRSGGAVPGRAKHHAAPRGAPHQAPDEPRTAVSGTEVGGGGGPRPAGPVAAGAAPGVHRRPCARAQPGAVGAELRLPHDGAGQSGALSAGAAAGADRAAVLPHPDPADPGAVATGAAGRPVGLDGRVGDPFGGDGGVPVEPPGPADAPGGVRHGGGRSDGGGVGSGGVADAGATGRRHRHRPGGGLRGGSARQSAAQHRGAGHRLLRGRRRGPTGARGAEVGGAGQYGARPGRAGRGGRPGVRP
ncbi:hypothetical protein KCH_09550 [Kitasatospora cheerisanensis KCTC 2395]|uniref:Uncharacterized protein n=1 Tax=Kitasatospora cheerisanensis KCTC 2395 TaxID=1348663 RepID=A0A066Z0L2_9ACTN|nr:hypothetical protein KCH_09550 [Kitasatospora cheerisanensis KCTC 2395]